MSNLWFPPLISSKPIIYLTNNIELCGTIWTIQANWTYFLAFIWKTTYIGNVLNLTKLLDSWFPLIINFLFIRHTVQFNNVRNVCCARDWRHVFMTSTAWHVERQPDDEAQVPDLSVWRLQHHDGAGGAADRRYKTYYLYHLLWYELLYNNVTMFNIWWNYCFL